MTSRRGKDTSSKKETGPALTRTARTSTSQEEPNATDVVPLNPTPSMTIDKKDTTPLVPIALGPVLGRSIVSIIIIVRSMIRTIGHARIVGIIRVIKYKGNHFLDLVEYSKKETGDVIIVKILTLNGEINVINVDVLKEI